MIRDTYQNIEVRERCLRDTPGDQLWEAHAMRIGPTVQTRSRKSVRAEATAAFKALHEPKPEPDPRLRRR